MDKIVHPIVFRIFHNFSLPKILHWLFTRPVICNKSNSFRETFPRSSASLCFSVLLSLSSASAAAAEPQRQPQRSHWGVWITGFRHVVAGIVDEKHDQNDVHTHVRTHNNTNTQNGLLGLVSHIIVSVSKNTNSRTYLFYL